MAGGELYRPVSTTGSCAALYGHSPPGGLPRMPDSTAAVIATNRFGLGARPGEIAACADDPRGWLEVQLKGPPLVIRDPELQNTATMVATIDKVRAQNRSLRAADSTANANQTLVAAVVKLGEIYRPAYVGEVTARLRL